MIAVVDYKMGNLLSVERGIRGALERLGCNNIEVHATSSAEEIASAHAIVLPGVGAFADAVASMNELGQASIIKQRIKDGIPFLGICLGLHLLCENGTEGAPDTENPTSGMGFIAQTVDVLPSSDAQGNSYKIPHVGWNTVNVSSENCALFSDIKQNEYFYFTHSYYVPVCDQTICKTTHSITMSSAVQIAPRAYAVQFHPEKSSDAGACLLENFVKIAFPSIPK